MIQDPGPLALHDLFLNTPAKPTWYSGRGMMGQFCLGITGSWTECQDALIWVLNEMHDAVVEEVYEESGEIDLSKVSQPFNDLVENLLHFSWDNMGNDVVLYFKAIPKPENV